jgi:hypothetical protein
MTDGLVLFEPALYGDFGHNARYARVIGREARRRGLPLTVLAHPSAPAGFLPELTEIGCRIMPVTAPLGWREREMGAVPALRGMCSHRSTLLWLSGSELDLPAAAVASRLLPCPVLFQMLPRGSAAPSPRLKRLMRAAARRNLIPCGQLDASAVLLSEDFGVPFRACPPIMDWTRPPRPPGRGGLPRVGLISVGHRRKKQHQVVDLVGAVTGCRWVVHWGSLDSTEGVAVLGRAAMLGAEVHLGDLSEERYQDLFESLDMVVLNYDPDSYGRKASGMLFEALGTGVIPVAPLGTVPGAILDTAGVGLLFDPMDPRALVDTLRDGLGRIDALRATARDFVAPWRAASDAGVLMDFILGSTERG